MRTSNPLAITVLSMALLAGCGLGKRGDAKAPARILIQRSTATAPEIPAPPGDVVGESGAAVVEGEGTAAVRQFHQLRHAMARATGVSPTDNQITQLFDSGKNLLSRDGNAEGVTPSMLMITTGLAGVYCGRFIEAERVAAAASRKVHGLVNFAQGHGTFNDAARRDVIAKYAELFWRRPPTPAEVNVLLLALDEAYAGRTNNAAELINGLRVICTSALSSLEFIQS